MQLPGRLETHEGELRMNKALHDYHVHDLNAHPSLHMYGDESFDAVFCSVSVDYLADPLPPWGGPLRVRALGADGLFACAEGVPYTTKHSTSFDDVIPCAKSSGLDVDKIATCFDPSQGS